MTRPRAGQCGKERGHAGPHANHTGSEWSRSEDRTLQEVAFAPEKGDRVVLRGGRVHYEVDFLTDEEDGYVSGSRVELDGRQDGFRVSPQVWFDLVMHAGSSVL